MCACIRLFVCEWFECPVQGCRSCTVCFYLFNFKFRQMNVSCSCATWQRRISSGPFKLPTKSQMKAKQHCDLCSPFLFFFKCNLLLRLLVSLSHVSRQKEWNPSGATLPFVRLAKQLGRLLDRKDGWIKKTSFYLNSIEIMGFCSQRSF